MPFTKKNFFYLLFLLHNVKIYEEEVARNVYASCNVLKINTLKKKKTLTV